jgi:hypothetical protein
MSMNSYAAYTQKRNKLWIFVKNYWKVGRIGHDLLAFVIIEYFLYHQYITESTLSYYKHT